MCLLAEMKCLGTIFDLYSGTISGFTCDDNNTSVRRSGKR